MNIHKGDTVQIRVGKDRGKTGKVFKIDAKNEAAFVEGLNLYKKHSRPKRQGQKGEIIAVPRTLAISKIMLYCSNCKKGTRVGYRLEKNGQKTRYCKHCEISL